MKALNIIYMGTPGFAVAPLKAILEAGHVVSAVVTVPDKPAGRGRKVHTSAVKDFAVENNLPVLQPEKLRDVDFIQALEALKPDVMVVVAFRMLPAVVWKIPSLGTFNLHASLLPQYRGAAPINWAVINGEKESGVTTFLIDDKIDTGGVLLQEKIALEPSETAGSLHDKLMGLGAELVVKTLSGLADGALEPQEQVESSALRNAPKIFRQDCCINWNKPGQEIEAFIRGLSPYPAAYTTIESKEISGDLKITKAKFHAVDSPAGDVQMRIEGKSLMVHIADGKMAVEELQPQGKRSMAAADFINGIHDKEQLFAIKR